MPMPSLDAGRRSAAKGAGPPRFTGKLDWEICSIPSLKKPVVGAMWRLFARYYDDVERDRFESDLAEKNAVILVWDAEHKLRGFSTIYHMDGDVEGKRFSAVFSGDTIVHPRFWGQTAMQRAYFRHMVRRKAALRGVPLYWFLTSKGYKTYLLLTNNYVTYYPRYDRPTPPFEAAVIDTLARKKFGSAWVPELGILRFPEKLGRLREGVAPIGPEELEHPHIRFFLERNPGHENGDELVCVGKVDMALFSRFLAKLAKRSTGWARPGKEARGR
jgi:hypothetical protein